VINSIHHTPLKVDQMVISFLDAKESKVLEWLNKENCLCALETDSIQNVVNIYSTDKSRLDTCARLIKDDIQCHNFDKLAKQFDDEVTIEFLNQMAESDDGFIWKCVNRHIVLCGFADQLRKVYSQFIEIFV
jgi:hypothetical protein